MNTNEHSDAIYNLSRRLLRNMNEFKAIKKRGKEREIAQIS